MAAVGFAVGLSGVSGARASDIDCKSPASASSVRCEDPRGAGMRCKLVTDDPGARAHQHHPICDSTRLSERYERIYAEQQRMLRKGTIRDADISAWRGRRDACDSARCLEGLFARFWRERDAMRNAPAGQAPVSQAATTMSSPATHAPEPGTAPQPATAPEPATAAAQKQPELLPSTEVPAARVGPQAEIAALTAPPVETPAAREGVVRSVDDGMNSSACNARPAALAMESLLSAAVLGAGAGFLWSRRSASRRNASPQGRPRSTVPAVMVIAYVLLLVNALLLPFTLGMK